MSARISGVKNFVSQKISFVRGFPFSHVQSASEKGSIFFGVPPAACVAFSCFGPIPAPAAFTMLELENPPAVGIAETFATGADDATTASPTVVTEGPPGDAGSAL